MCFDIQHSDTQHYGILHNYTQHDGHMSDTQHKGPMSDTQHKGPMSDTQHKGPMSDTQHKWHSALKHSGSRAIMLSVAIYLFLS